MPTSVSAGQYQRQIWPCVILLLLTLAIRLPLLGVPFERDEGEYAYIGWRLEHHELPYRDWIDQKPPAIFWVYRTAFALPLNPVYAVHLMALLFAAASACALFFLALRFMSRGWAWLVAILFALLSVDPLLYGTEANTEMFMLLPLILSVLAFFRATPETAGRWREIGFAVLVGIFVGIATAFKQVAVVQWPFLILMFPLFADGKKSFARMLLFAIASAAGIAVVWAAIVLYFALHHALGDFMYNVFTHNLEYVQSIPWSRRLGYLANTLKSLAADEWPVWIFSVIGLMCLLRDGRFKDLLFLAGWMLASFMGVSASGYYFPHYFQQMLPVFCLTAGFAAGALEGTGQVSLARVWLRRIIFAAVLIIPVAMVLCPFLFSYSRTEAADEIYPENHFAEKQVLAERLAQVTKPDDKVFIFGADTEILFYAQRVSATRYIFLFPLYGPYSDAKQKQMAAADEITSNAPAAVLYLPNQLFFTPDTEQFFTHWSQSYITQNFRVDSCLAVDQSNNVVVVTDLPHQKPSMVNGLKVFGELDVLKNNSAK
jgi:4-amino-4-deoxy-L-arabinose transferase-like glycosyltransferase